MKTLKKHEEYALKLQVHISEIFNEDSDSHINQQDFADGENFKAFLHALSTLVPCSIYNKLAEDKEDIVGFNHIANRLCFEYMEK